MVLFLLVGAVGFVVDIGTLVPLVQLAGLPFAAARIGGFITAVSSNFVLHERYTFRDGVPKAHTRPRRFLLYLGAASIGLAVNWLVSVGLFESFEWFENHYAVAASVGVVAGTAFNFAGAKLVAFAKKPAGRGPQDTG